MLFEQFCHLLQDRSFPLELPGHFLAGNWVKDQKGEVLHGSFNPSRGDSIAKIYLSKKIIEQAINAAEAAQAVCEAMSFSLRLDRLVRLRQILADYGPHILSALCIEAGKPRWEARLDLLSALQQLDTIIAEGDQILDVLLGPSRLGWPESEFRLQSNGITLAFIPFSTPVATFIQCLSGALIAGSPLVLMPSSHAVLCGALFAYILQKLELPDGSVNIIFGNYQTFLKTIADRRIQAVIYSGSREHCDAIRRDHSAQLGRQLLLQSGGKNSVIVDKNASVPDAVQCILYGLIKNAGQLNTSTSRAFVHESMLADFKQEMVRAVRNLRIGQTDGEDDPHLGPLYAQKAVDKFLRYQTMAKREAAETWVWGKVYQAGGGGYCVIPGVHLMESLDTSSSYQTNVLMCPDVAVYSYKDVAQAIDAANTTDAALVTSLVGDVPIVREWIPKLRVPNVLINLPTVGLGVYPPIAGRRLCGDYRANGVGMAFLLTYPQSCRTAQLGEDGLLASFPVID